MESQSKKMVRSLFGITYITTAVSTWDEPSISYVRGGMRWNPAQMLSVADKDGEQGSLVRWFYTKIRIKGGNENE